MLGLMAAAALGEALAERPKDAAAFANLLVYETAERSCVGRKAPDVQACVRAEIGSRFTKTAMETFDPNLSEDKRDAVPRRLAGPNLIAASLNDYDMGLTFRVVECRVVADITDQQRHNIAKVAVPALSERQRLLKAHESLAIPEDNRGPELLKAAMRPFDLDLEELDGKFVLSVVNLSTLGPPDPRFPSSCLSRIRAAYETGDLSRVVADRCTSGAAAQHGQTPQASSGPERQRTSALDRLKSKLAKLREADADAGKPDSNESEAKAKLATAPMADPCLATGVQTEVRMAGAANRPSDAPPIRTPAPITGNPFEAPPPPPGKFAYTLTGEEARKVRDDLPGYAYPPEGALVADLTHGLGTSERSRRLQAAVSFLMTSAGFQARMEYRKKPEVFDELLATFSGAGPAERFQMLGKVFLQMMRVPVFDPAGQRRSFDDLTTNVPSPPTSIFTAPLWEKLQPPPATQPSSFYTDNPGPLDGLYRVLVIQRRPEAGRPAWIVERYVPFRMLTGLNLAERAPDGRLVLGGFAMANDGGSTRGYIQGLGYFYDEGSRLVYRAPGSSTKQPPVLVYDLGAISLAQQEARREMLQRSAAARLSAFGFSTDALMTSERRAP